MDTNFRMLSELLDKFHPESRGMLTGEEVRLVEDALCIKEMDGLQLQNLRDFTVMFMSDRHDREKEFELHFEDLDKMSAITAVIDSRKLKLGLEV